MGVVLVGELEGAGRAAVERLDQQLAAELLEPARELAEVGLADRNGSRSATGPESRPAVSRMIETPVSTSPAMIARSIGAAPRQRGSSDGCTLSSSKLREQRLADQLAEGADDAEIRPRGADPLERLGSSASLGLDARSIPRSRRPPRPASATSCDRARGGGRAG